jgi:hypothetical protein
MVKLNHALRGAVVAIALLAPASSAFAQSDAQIRQSIIKESIASYPGNCPCPYNSASNGSRCGGRSAYNRAGGYAPICFAEDVTPEMVRQYKARRGGR